MTRPRFLIYDKPDGFGEGDLIEALSRFSPQPPDVVHRLPTDASGVLLLADTPEAAHAARAAVSEGRARIRHLFVTDRPPPNGRTEFADAARTQFARLQTAGRLSLWSATGSEASSAMSSAASASGLPILGDKAHGGAPFPRLLLHCEALTLDLGTEVLEARSTVPVLLRELALCERGRLARWLCGADRRERWMRSRAQAAGLATDPRAADTDAWRRLHTDGIELRSDCLGDVEWLGWFSPTPPAEADWFDIQDFLRVLERPRWILQHRADRGSGNASTALWTSAGLPARWTGRENGVAYEFRRDQGLSCGLFLDQRANRLWTMRNSRDSRVLNLFCYTAGFSACAALGGAGLVVSSDLSRPFLDWGRRNFELNGLRAERHEFRAIDSREYLKWAKKKQLSFDLIVCDPPSFSRSEKGVFRLERDFGALVAACARALAPGGRLLVCTNFEGWDDAAFRLALSSLGTGFRQEPSPGGECDFEGPHEARQMKSALIRRTRP